MSETNTSNTSNTSKPATKKATRKPKKVAEQLNFNHEQTPVCAATGLKESEVDVLIKVGEIYLSPQAIQTGVAQLSTWRRDLRSK